MHQGIARVVGCFLAKFGMLYIFITWVFSLISMYAFLMYITSDSVSSSGSSSQPMAPSSSDEAKMLLQKNRPHLKLASNLKHLQDSLISSLNDTLPEDSNLLSFIHKYSILPTCDQKIFLSIFIASAPRNFRQRNAIRKTWCSLNMTSTVWIDQRTVPDYTTRCFFLIGRSLSHNIQKAVNAEALQHQDILQGLYLDSYRNLTLKVLQGFIWSHELCPAFYILKTDDDCFVNVPVLKTLLGKASSGRNMYIGHVMYDADRRKVIRDTGSKWRVSSSQYSLQYYPPYASGFGYLISWDVVEVISSIFQSINMVPVEDAYIGIVLSSVGITPTHSARFSVHSLQWHLCNLLYFVVIHKVTIETQSLLTSQCVRSYRECSIKSNHAFSWD